MNIITTTRETNKESELNGKVIRKAQLARQLLRKGGQIIDVKADHSDPDGKRSVFVFLNNDAFQKMFTDVLNENKQNRNMSETDDLKKQIKELNKKLEALTESKEKE